MEKKLTLSKRPLQWLSLVVVMLLAFLPDAQASQRFYYHAKVTADPSAGGKVYASSQATTPAYDEDNPSQFEFDGEGWGIIGSGGTESTLYLYAEPNNNYLFDHWENGSGTNVSSSPQYNPTIEYHGERWLGIWTTARTQITYKAVFKKQTGAVKVKSANESLGSVNIDNIDNAVGDEVTLSAFPDVSNGVLFLGWTYGDDVNNTDYVSHENPWKFTITDDNKGWYVAHFSDPATRMYVRLQNKKTGRFISFYGDNNGDKATLHTRTSNGRTVNDGFDFTGCFKMMDKDKAQGNPETVFMRSGHVVGTGFMNAADLTAHGKAYSYTSLIDGKVSVNLTSGAYMLNIRKAGDNTYHIYTSFEVPGEDGTLESYFCDEGGNKDYLVMKSIAGLENFDPESAEWYIYNLDANATEGAFGANAKKTYEREGKYYTTMYTDFAYQCLDNVNAYYLPNTEDGEEPNYNEEYQIVYLTKVPKGKVPANMAVVLECPVPQNAATNGPSAVTNRLLPLFDPVEEIIGEEGHFLKGYVSVNGHQEPNDRKTKFVLSYINHLAFYLFDSDFMTPNKAYLDLSKLHNQESGASIRISFDNTGLGTDGISQFKKDLDNGKTPVYDLYGRRMKGSLPKGIYVRNGRKFVVK